MIDMQATSRWALLNPLPIQHQAKSKALHSPIGTDSSVAEDSP